MPGLKRGKRWVLSEPERRHSTPNGKIPGLYIACYNSFEEIRYAIQNQVRFE